MLGTLFVAFVILIHTSQESTLSSKPNKSLIKFNNHKFLASEVT